MNMVFILLIILGFLLQFSKILQNKFKRAEKGDSASYCFILHKCIIVSAIYQQFNCKYEHYEHL